MGIETHHLSVPAILNKLLDRLANHRCLRSFGSVDRCSVSARRVELFLPHIFRTAANSISRSAGVKRALKDYTVHAKQRLVTRPKDGESFEQRFFFIVALHRLR